MCNFVGFIKSFPFAYGEAIIRSGWYLKYVSLFALLGLTVHASNTYDIQNDISAVSFNETPHPRMRKPGLISFVTRRFSHPLGYPEQTNG